MKAIVNLILFSCLLMAGCISTHISAPKDQRAIDLERKIQTDYTFLYSASDLNFTSRENDYSKIEGEISALLTLEQSRPSSGNLVTQVKILQNMFLKFEGEHRSKGVINKSEASVYKLYLDGPMQNILNSENGKK